MKCLELVNSNARPVGNGQATFIKSLRDSKLTAVHVLDPYFGPIDPPRLSGKADQVSLTVGAAKHLTNRSIN
jgi:hypothetical protein